MNRVYELGPAADGIMLRLPAELAANKRAAQTDASTWGLLPPFVDTQVGPFYNQT